MKGVILAAGKGTRLYPATLHIAKPLLPIANRPILAYALDRLKEIGVHEICLVVGENEGQLRGALGSGRQFGVSLTYVRQDAPHGLAHALDFAKDFCGKEPFAMYLGDAIHTHNLVRHAQRFLDSDCASLNVVMWVDDPRRFGVAVLNGERIERLVEKPQNPESNHAMAGLYFFRSQIWNVLPDLMPSARGEYEITDAIQMLIDRGETVIAGIYEGEWHDTGTLSSFLEAAQQFTKGGMLIDPSASVDGEVGPNVVIGAGATLACKRIEDATVLPGTRATCRGSIRHSLLGSSIRCDEDIENQILYPDC